MPMRYSPDKFEADFQSTTLDWIVQHSSIKSVSLNFDMTDIKTMVTNMSGKGIMIFGLERAFVQIGIPSLYVVNVVGKGAAVDILTQRGYAVSDYDLELHYEMLDRPIDAEWLKFRS
jgi:hypothetical protein